jgi:hypothetical protein
MSKPLVFASFAAVLLLTTAYFGLHSFLDKLAPSLKPFFDGHGVEFTYSRSARSPSGVGVVIEGVTLLEKSSSYALRVVKLKASLSLAAAFPPLRISVNLEHPELLSLPDRKTAESSELRPVSPGVGMALTNLFLKLTEFEISIVDGEINPLEANEILGSIQVRHVYFGSTGLESATVTHEFLFHEFSNVPLLSKTLTNIHWTGRTSFENGVLSAKNQRIALGPFVLSFDGSRKQNGEWKAKLTIPQTSLSPASNAINAQTLSWLRNIEGTLRLDLNFKGVGKTFTTQGNLLAKNIHATIDSDGVRGEMRSDIDFTLTDNLPTGTLQLDLSKIEIQQDDTFFKARGTPFLFDSEIHNDGQKIKITRAEATLGTVKVTASGEVNKTSPYRSELSFQIPQTSLKHWDEYFPKYSSVPMGGTLECKASFSGEINEWRAGRFEVAVNGTKLRAPLLANWFSPNGLIIDGMTNMNISGHGILDKHALRQLSAHGFVDLKDSEISVGNAIKKSPEIPMSLQFAVSGANVVEIKNVVMKGLGGTILGNAKIDLTEHPAKTTMEVRTSSINSTELLSLFTSRQDHEGKLLSGRLSGEATLDFVGQEKKTILSSMTGSGHLSLIDGTLAPIQFMKKPTQVLSKIPALSRTISHAPGEEKLNQMTIKFDIADEEFSSREFSVQNAYYEVTGSQLTVGFDENIKAKVNWFPKSSLIPKEILLFLEDKKKIGIPLSIEGPLWAPQITADTSQFEARMKELADGQFREQVEKRIQGGLGHAFK